MCYRYQGGIVFINRPGRYNHEDNRNILLRITLDMLKTEILKFMQFTARAA